jgi:hypothetical protein
MFFFLGYDIFITAAFVTAMERFGFEGVDAFDIVNTGKIVREEMQATDPEKAIGL